jgi:hypothetical protein
MLKKTVFTFILLAAALLSFAQDERAGLDRITDSLMAEGKTLYRSEWTSWYGTDAFMAKCPQKKELSGGYFSYETEQNLVNIFFSRDDNPKVIATITFQKDFNTENYMLDTTVRKFTGTEQKYFDIRKAAVDYMKTDTIFKGYKNTTLNLVPIIENNEKKLYVLTGTDLHGVVIFGNDYLMYFDNNNLVTSARPLHKNIIPVYSKSDSGKTQKETFHIHLSPTDEFITATDICTLMLYEKLTTWETHFVRSKNYVSIWDCKTNQLVIMTREAIERIQEDQEKRHPDKKDN